MIEHWGLFGRECFGHMECTARFLERQNRPPLHINTTKTYSSSSSKNEQESCRWAPVWRCAKIEQHTYRVNPEQDVISGTRTAPTSARPALTGPLGHTRKNVYFRRREQEFQLARAKIILQSGEDVKNDVLPPPFNLIKPLLGLVWPGG